MTEPASRYANRVGAVDVAGVPEAREKIRPDGDMDPRRNRPREIGHLDDRRVEKGAQMSSRLVGCRSNHGADFDAGVRLVALRRRNRETVRGARMVQRDGVGLLSRRRSPTDGIE